MRPESNTRKLADFGHHKQANIKHVLPDGGGIAGFIHTFVYYQTAGGLQGSVIHRRTGKYSFQQGLTGFRLL